MGTHMKRNLLLIALCATVALVCFAVPAMAQSGDKVERIPLGNPDIPIASAVIVPAGYDTIYVSGHIAKVANPNAAKGSIEMYGDTKTQTISVLQQIQDELAAQQLSMSDVVMVHVCLLYTS